MADKPAHRGKGYVDRQGQGHLWVGSANEFQIEIKNLSQKLREAKARHSHIDGQKNLHEANTSLSDLNEELLMFCKTNRRKYKKDDRPEKLDRKVAEHEKMIKQYEDREQKLKKDLTEAIKAKENALNRLSELQSRLLKYNNPEITDLSDENRPTILGSKFKQVYENEWTDAFEFLTEKKDAFDDEKAITVLYSMLKTCNELCSEALTEQHVTLARVVTDPTYLKFQKGTEQRPEVKTETKVQTGYTGTTKVDVRPQPVTQMNSKQSSFAQTVPAKGTVKQATAQWQQGNSQGKPITTLNKNQQPGGSESVAQTSPRSPNSSQQPGAPISPGTQMFAGNPNKSGTQNPSASKTEAKLPDFYDAGKGAEPTSPASGGEMLAGKLQLPVREFSKMVASEVLARVKLSDILHAIKRKGNFSDDILQNGDIQKYLEQCFHLSWQMQVQYPPMVMDLETKPRAKFDSSVFDVYTNRGTTIALVVWPPVYLHKDGPVVCKGYADCVKITKV